MPRFLKGTMDHDSDGKRGGSLKGDTTMAKKAATKRKTVQADDLPETKQTEAAKKAAAEKTFAKADEAAAPERTEGDDIRMRQAALGGL